MNENKETIYENIITEALSFIYDRCWLPSIDSHVNGETFLSMKPDEVEMLANILKKGSDVKETHDALMEVHICSNEHWSNLK